MEKGMEKEKNIMKMAKYYLMENLKMENGIMLEKNIFLKMVN